MAQKFFNVTFVTSNLKEVRHFRHIYLFIQTQGFYFLRPNFANLRFRQKMTVFSDHFRVNSVANVSIKNQIWRNIRIFILVSFLISYNAQYNFFGLQKYGYYVADRCCRQLILLTTFQYWSPIFYSTFVDQHYENVTTIIILSPTS